MKRFISFSGGVESRTMCVLYGDKVDGVIFADTGSEHEKLYSEIELFQEAIQKIHPGLKIFLVRNEKWDSLENYIKHSKFFPSFRARFCTRMFKIEPIDDFLSQFRDEGAEIMIGLNADEGDRRTGNHGLLSFVKYSYPLYEQGITRAMCIGILKAMNVYPDFPPYMRRGGCKFCYYKSRKEFQAMIALVPNEFNQVIALENDLQDNRETFYAIRDTIPEGMEALRDNFDAQGSLFDYSEVYATVNDATSCGVFCNR